MRSFYESTYINNNPHEQALCFTVISRFVLRRSHLSTAFQLSVIFFKISVHQSIYEKRNNYRELIHESLAFLLRDITGVKRNFFLRKQSIVYDFVRMLTLSSFYQRSTRPQIQKDIKSLCYHCLSPAAAASRRCDASAVRGGFLSTWFFSNRTSFIKVAGSTVSLVLVVLSFYHGNQTVKMNDERLNEEVVRFINALKIAQIPQKLADLTAIINTTIAGNPRVLHSFFISIISTAFDLPNVHLNSPFGSLGGSELFPSWKIRSTYKEDNALAFDRLIEFFSPSSGIFFRLLRILSADPTGSKCDFPITELPLPARESILQGTPSQFYANYLINNASFISVSPLKYFLLSLFRYIRLDQETVPTTRLMQESFNSTDKSSESALLVLFEAYLDHFLPIDTIQPPIPNSPPGQAQHSIWESLSNRTSHLLHLQQTSDMSMDMNRSPVTLSPGPLYQQRLQMQRPSLINMKQVTRGEASTNELNCDVLGTSRSKAELFLDHFTEMVLNVVPRKKGALKSLSPFCTSHQIQPSIDHVRCVRMFIKCFHYFINSRPSHDTLADPQFKVGRSPLESLKFKLYSELTIHLSLFNFLRYSFEIWPLDASFKFPLETWLSYIQPWRYQSKNAALTGTRNTARVENIKTEEWLHFVKFNLPFYNSIAYMAFQKFTRFDLLSTKNASMLSRIIKVYSNPGFIDLVKQAENNLNCNINDVNKFFQSNYLDTSGRKIQSDSYSPTHHQLIKSTMASPDAMITDNCDHDIEFILMNSDKFKEITRDLYKCIRVAQNIIREQIGQLKNNENKCDESSNISVASVFSFVSSLFDSPSSQIDDSHHINQLNYIYMQLNTSDGHMMQIFGQPFALHQIQEMTVLNAASNDSTDTSRSIDPSINELRMRYLSTPLTAGKQPSPKADTVVTDDGSVQLSPLGRFQLKNRIAQANYPTVEGNPDLQATRSYEIHLLVIMLHVISTFINDRTRLYIDKWYPDGSPLSKFLQFILSPPVAYSKFVKGNSLTRRYFEDSVLTPAKRVVEHLPPRVNLRFFASKINLLLIFFLYCFTRLIGWSLINCILYTLVLLLLYSVAAYLSRVLSSIQ